MVILDFELTASVAQGGFVPTPDGGVSRGNAGNRDDHDLICKGITIQLAELQQKAAESG